MNFKCLVNDKNIFKMIICVATIIFPGIIILDYPEGVKYE